MRKYIDRLIRMDSLIRRKATGSPTEFAAKMNMSRSALMRNLAEIRKLDAPIEYDNGRQTYYYSEEVKFNFGFKKLDGSSMEKQVGGSFFRVFFRVSKYETDMFNIYN